jgi:hypothetical protein
MRPRRRSPEEAAVHAAETLTGLQFNEPSNEENTPRIGVRSARVMETIHCSNCGVRVAHVRDTRFGMLPAATVCPFCSVPAFQRRFVFAAR